MRVLVQRVKHASVTVADKVVGSIDHGLLAFLGICHEDKPEDTVWMVNKMLNLRIFRDDQDKMNLSVKDVGGSVLVVSQFTLYGECQKGRRPDFFNAAAPKVALPIYEKFISEVGKEVFVASGEFGANMQVELLNDGPVTLLIEK